MFTPDEVAGVVDVFGALTPEETAEALSELAYRRRGTPPENAIEEAIASFALLEFDDGEKRLVAPGPAAFPELPDGGEDLPHILDVEDRSPDRERLRRAATSRLRSEAEQAITDDDGERAGTLLEVSYDIEAWGGSDLSSIRARLEPVADDTN